LANPYMIPCILKIPHGQPEVWRTTNWEWEEYAKESPPEFFQLWQPNERKWLKSMWEKAEFQAFVQTHIDLRQRLTNESVGPVRSDLVKRLYALADAPKAEGRLRVVKSSEGEPRH
jgi:hypothetical protein